VAILRSGNSRLGLVYLQTQAPFDEPGGIGFSWDATLREVDAALESRRGDTTADPRPDSAAPPDGKHYPPNATPTEKGWIDIYELTKAMPSAAVLISFTQVEMALREHLRERGVEGDLNRMGVGMLLHRGSIDPDLAGAVRQLSTLRNEVAHLNAKPSSQEAEEYMTSAWRVSEVLRGKL
jgi:hypothetical protein